MGENSKIEWTHHTFNPWRGCSKVSAGCGHCYAETLSRRNPGVLGVWGDNGTRVVASEAAWREPLRWDRAAKSAGERHRVFCASLADVFEDRPELVEPRIRLRWLMYETPNLDWLLLTKRPDVAARWFADYLMPENVWLGTSVEDQATADERIPHLLQIPAAVRFVSAEPLLSSVDLSPWLGVSNEAEEHRRSSLQIRVRRDTLGRQPGSSLEDQREAASPCGEVVRFLSPGSDHEGGYKASRPCSQAGLEDPSRPDPGRHDDQSQGREQDEQPSGQLGASHRIGTGDPRESCTREVQTGWGAEQQRQTDDEGRRNHQASSRERRASQDDCSRLSSQRSDGVEDRSGPSLGIHWIICGGESGPGARPMHPKWAKAIRDQCVEAQVPYFFKQFGEWAPGSNFPETIPSGVSHDFGIPDLTDEQKVWRVGKKAAGRLLDGVEWSQFPEASRCD